MEVGEIKKELIRLQNLKGNKDMSEADLERQAKINLLCREFKADPLFIDPKEQELAEKKYRMYLETSEIESASDMDTLRSLVYNEVFETRLQKELNKMNNESKMPPDRLTTQLTDFQNQKMELKVKLGIDAEEGESDELTGLQTFKLRMKKYINANKEEFTCICPHGTPMLLRRKVKDFDAMEHPWFAGRWLFNYEILKDVKDKKLSKQDAWRYLCCASLGGNYKPAFDKTYCEDYIDYCLKHWAEITSFLEKK